MCYNQSDEILSQQKNVQAIGSACTFLLLKIFLLALAYALRDVQYALSRHPHLLNGNHITDIYTQTVVLLPISQVG
jgi:hypothetical protein